MKKKEKGPKGHKWAFIPRISWPYCRCCGLLRLKNERIEQAVRRPCVEDAE